MIALSFGQAYAKLALFLYGGSALATGIGPVLLKLHCLAILFLAVNGITECYAAATMNVAELNKFVVCILFLFTRLTKIWIINLLHIYMLFSCFNV